jgi:hypothetical protein
MMAGGGGDAPGAGPAAVARAPPRSRPAAIIDTSALAALNASEAAATAAALQQQLEAAGLTSTDGICNSAACAPAAAAAAAEAAAVAAAAAATVGAMVGAGGGSGGGAPSSAAAAAMLNINICSTALAALAPRGADLCTLNTEFSAILDATEEWVDTGCFEGASAANVGKNRYTNILPFDANRVPLDPAAAAGARSQPSATGTGAPMPEPQLPCVVTLEAPRRGGGLRGVDLFGDAGRPPGGEGGSSNYFNGSFIRVRRRGRALSRSRRSPRPRQLSLDPCMTPGAPVGAEVSRCGRRGHSSLPRRDAPLDAAGSLALLAVPWTRPPNRIRPSTAPLPAATSRRRARCPRRLPTFGRRCASRSAARSSCLPTTWTSAAPSEPHPARASRHPQPRGKGQGAAAQPP